MTPRASQNTLLSVKGAEMYTHLFPLSTNNMQLFYTFFIILCNPQFYRHLRPFVIPAQAGIQPLISSQTCHISQIEFPGQRIRMEGNSI